LQPVGVFIGRLKNACVEEFFLESSSLLTAEGARYVAIITDGNGRWATQRRLPVLEGHRAGAENLRARIRDAAELGVEELVVFAFSTENWARSEEEVQGLMALIALYIERETPSLHENGVRMRFIGRREEPVPVRVLERMEWAEELTHENDRITLTIPLNYGGRAEIVDAARAFTGATEEEFRSHLYASDLHDPQIIIRTGGERRLSNYLLWQAADAELVFRQELWPDFGRTAFEAVLVDYFVKRRAREERE
jgi:undecaprenyl diphosphate synthase